MKTFSLFLRDAGVILDDKEVNFLKRFYRCVELAEKNGLHVQITLDEQYFLSDHLRLTNELTAHLQKFEKVLIHLHTSHSKRFGRNAFTDNAFLILAEFIAKCGNIRGVCVHPDHTEDFSVLERLKINDIYVAIEIQTGNLYAPEVMGAGFVTSHSLLTLKNDNLVRSLSALNPVGEVNTVIEGIIPPGEYGETCLRNEVTQLRKYLCA